MLHNIASFLKSCSGKKKLEEEIMKLQSALAGLEADNMLKVRLEKYKETQRNAVSSKLMAEEALNKAEARMTTLKEQLRSNATEEEYRSIPVRTFLNLHETWQILAILDSMHSIKHTFISMYLPWNYNHPQVWSYFMTQTI